MIKYYLGEASHAIRNRIPGFFQRGMRGWAKHDTWGFDHYLARVIAEGLEHLADNAHGTPGFIFEKLGFDFVEPTKEQSDAAFAEWKFWLRDKAKWFRWYEEENIGLRPDMTPEERISCLDFYDKQQKHFDEVVLPDFWKHFGNLWD